MKTYVKPTMEVIELRVEERLAVCGGSSITGKNIRLIILELLFGKSCLTCKFTTVGKTCS